MNTIYIKPSSLPIQIGMALIMCVLFFGAYQIIKQPQVSMEPNRKLQWRDFKIVRSIANNPQINAICIITADVKITGQKTHGDHKRISVRVNLELDKNRTQVSGTFLSRATPELKKQVLNHENGHVQIAKIVANDIVDAIEIFEFDPKEFPEQLDSLVKIHYKKWNDLDRKYDRETTKPRNPEKQVEWDGYFKKGFIP